MKPLEVRRAQVHEIVVLGATVVAALAGLVVPDTRSRAVLATLPEWTIATYYAGIAGGALIALVGAVWFGILRRRSGDLLPALGVERVGLAIVGPLQMAYGVALASLGTLTATFPACTALAVGVAHVYRTHQITADIRRYRRAAMVPQLADPPLADPGPPT